MCNVLPLPHRYSVMMTSGLVPKEEAGRVAAASQKRRRVKGGKKDDKAAKRAHSAVDGLPDRRRRGHAGIRWSWFPKTAGVTGNVAA